MLTTRMGTSTMKGCSLHPGIQTIARSIPAITFDMFLYAFMTFLSTYQGIFKR